MAYSSSYSALITLDQISGIRGKGFRKAELCSLAADAGYLIACRRQNVTIPMGAVRSNQSTSA